MERDIGRVTFQAGGVVMASVRVWLRLHRGFSAADGEMSHLSQDAVSPRITRTGREHIADTHPAPPWAHEIRLVSVGFRIGGLEVGVA